jgi:hypothetical protein
MKEELKTCRFCQSKNKPEIIGIEIHQKFKCPNCNIKDTVVIDSQWISVNDKLPKAFSVVLTQHIDDLYPVSAYWTNEEWIREIEGAEDLIIQGKQEILCRPPTHWRPLPEQPRNKK